MFAKNIGGHELFPYRNALFSGPVEDYENEAFSFIYRAIIRRRLYAEGYTETDTELPNSPR